MELLEILRIPDRLIDLAVNASRNDFIPTSIYLAVLEVESPSDRAHRRLTTVGNEDAPVAAKTASSRRTPGPITTIICVATRCGTSVLEQHRWRLWIPGRARFASAFAL
jgi:hypothetical protein